MKLKELIEVMDGRDMKIDRLVKDDDGRLKMKLELTKQTVDVIWYIIGNYKWSYKGGLTRHEIKVMNQSITEFEKAVELAMGEKKNEF